MWSGIFWCLILLYGEFRTSKFYSLLSFDHHDNDWQSKLTFQRLDVCFVWWWERLTITWQDGLAPWTRGNLNWHFIVWMSILFDDVNDWQLLGKMTWLLYQSSTRANIVVQLDNQFLHSHLIKYINTKTNTWLKRKRPSRPGSSGIKNFQSREFRDGILQNPGIPGFFGTGLA